MNNKLHHIAIVVNDIEKSLNFLLDVYNARAVGSVYVDKNQLVKVQFIMSEALMIELLEPLNDKSPVKTALEKNGSGSLYHIAYEVDCLSQIAKEVRKKGGIVISNTKQGWGGMEVMFAIFINGDEKQLVEYIKIN